MKIPLGKLIKFVRMLVKYSSFQIIIINSRGIKRNNETKKEVKENIEEYGEREREKSVVFHDIASKIWRKWYERNSDYVLY